VWYERPYYLGTGSKSLAYFALARALEQRGSVGVAQWVMRKRRYYGAIRPIDSHLALVSVRTVEEVAIMPKLKPNGRTIDPRELTLAEQLVDALTGEFDPTAFRDEHRRRVLDLIAAKASGKHQKFWSGLLRVPPEHLVRGYGLDDGSLVALTDEELEAQNPKESREIDLRPFVDRDSIDPIFFERGYFLVPGRDSGKPYGLLSAVMERTRRASFVMRDKEHLIAIFSEHGLLVGLEKKVSAG
jgi:non-homologous end joining protein Ku